MKFFYTKAFRRPLLHLNLRDPRTSVERRKGVELGHQVLAIPLIEIPVVVATLATPQASPLQIALETCQAGEGGTKET